MKDKKNNFYNRIVQLEGTYNDHVVQMQCYYYSALVCTMHPLNTHIKEKIPPKVDFPDYRNFK